MLMLAIMIKKITSNMRGKCIDYCPEVINVLLDLHPLGQCGIQNRRSRNHMLREQMCEIMKNKLCRPGEEWDVV